MRPRAFLHCEKFPEIYNGYSQIIIPGEKILKKTIAFILLICAALSLCACAQTDTSAAPAAGSSAKTVDEIISSWDERFSADISPDTFITYTGYEIFHQGNYDVIWYYYQADRDEWDAKENSIGKLTAQTYLEKLSGEAYEEFAASGYDDQHVAVSIRDEASDAFCYTVLDGKVIE